MGIEIGDASFKGDYRRMLNIAVGAFIEAAAV